MSDYQLGKILAVCPYCGEGHEVTEGFDTVALGGVTLPIIVCPKMPEGRVALVGPRGAQRYQAITIRPRVTKAWP